MKYRRNRWVTGSFQEPKNIFMVCGGRTFLMDCGEVRGLGRRRDFVLNQSLRAETMLYKGEPSLICSGNPVAAADPPWRDGVARNFCPPKKAAPFPTKAVDNQYAAR